MVSDHGLGRGLDHGVGVDPETVTYGYSSACTLHLDDRLRYRG